jgi:hypothetical protein
MNWLNMGDDDSDDDEQAKQQKPKSFNTNTNTSISSVGFRSSCCGRFEAELNPCQTHFHVTDRATGRDFDIPESFAPKHPTTMYYWMIVLFKGFGTAASIGTLVGGWLDLEYDRNANNNNNRKNNFYLAYAEHWGVVFCSIYFLLSLWNMIWAERTPQQVTCRICVTWVMAQMAAHWEALVTVSYWYFLHDWENNPTDDLGILSLVVHGLLALLVWIDIFYVNRIPFRWMHWVVYIVPSQLLWVLWSFLQAFVGDLGNPDTNGNGDSQINGDLIYQDIDWKGDWHGSTISVVILIFAVGPVLFLILWLFSIYQWPCICRKDRRKYVDSFRDDMTPMGPTVNDVEEGSIFQKWTSD